MSRFQDDWMEDEVLKDWLVKVSNDESRAYCRFCAIVLRAHKTDLTTHSVCQKHIANAKEAIESGAPAAPISVQIVCNDNDNDDDPNESGNEVEQKPIVAKRKRPSRTTSPSKKKPTSSYRKKYRIEWEEDPELADWLTPFPKDEAKAFCKRCGVLLRAHKHDLLLHSRSVRHKNSIGTDVTVTDLEERLGDSINGSYANNSTNSKRGKNETISDDGMDADDPIGNMMGFDDTNDSNDDIVDTRPPSVTAKRSSPIKEKPKPYSSKKRGRIIAADVVAAIENNEFTGYELLQLVKVCVPRL